MSSNITNIASDFWFVLKKSMNNYLSLEILVVLGEFSAFNKFYDFLYLYLVIFVVMYKYRPFKSI